MTSAIGSSGTGRGTHTVDGSRTLWGIGRWTAMLATLGLLVGLLLRPAITLKVLWFGIVPVLPFSFFLSPALWRGVCPLSTFNEWGNRIGRPRLPSERQSRWLGIIGLGLFYLMVPARRFLFNQHGPAVVLAVVAVGVTAVALGALFVARSGFCNGLCPVLPVERLYGQTPLVRLDRGRCTTCTICLPRGCLDLAGPRTVAQILGPTRRTTAWIGEPLGVFAATLPGFVLGFSLLPNLGLEGMLRVYGTALGLGAASYLVVLALVRLLRLDATVGLAVLAAAAGAIYYWFAGPSIVAAWNAPTIVSSAIRLLGLGLIGYWLLRATRARAH